MSNDKAKKNTWIPVNDGEKIPLLGREDYITKVLNNVKTEEDLDNLLTLQELTEIEAEERAENNVLDNFNDQTKSFKDIAKDVYQYLIKNSNVKAIEIANHLGIPRELVNHVLYRRGGYGLRGWKEREQNAYEEWIDSIEVEEVQDE